MTMNGLEKIIDHIRSASEAECGEISRKAAEECKRIRAGYSRTEQDEYWKYIDEGTKEAQRRGRQLAALADAEANKQILATQQELVDEAFSRAAESIRGLSKSDYARLLSRLKLKPDCSAGDVVAKFRNQLTQNITSMLFD